MAKRTDITTDELNDPSDGAAPYNDTGYDKRAEMRKIKQAQRDEQMIEEGIVSDAESLDHLQNNDLEAAADTIEQPQRHKIKVNGREFDLSYEELVARAQKVESADEYLRNAKTQSDLVNTAYMQPSPEDVVDEINDLELVRAIQMGNEEEATAAIRQLRQANKPSVDSDDLFRQFDERARASSASKKFASEFSDIFADPILKNLAFQEDARLMSEGDTRSYDDRYASIGNSIRDWRDSLTNNTAANDKIQRKLNAAPVPKASGRQVQEVEQEAPEETRSQMIARIAKQRGQAY